MNKQEIQRCKEFFKKRFYDYGAPNTVMFTEDDFDKFMLFVYDLEDQQIYDEKSVRKEFGDYIRENGGRN